MAHSLATSSRRTSDSGGLYVGWGRAMLHAAATAAGLSRNGETAEAIETVKRFTLGLCNDGAANGRRRAAHTQQCSPS